MVLIVYQVPVLCLLPVPCNSQLYMTSYMRMNVYTYVPRCAHWLNGIIKNTGVTCENSAINRRKTK